MNNAERIQEHEHAIFVLTTRIERLERLLEARCEESDDPEHREGEILSCGK